MNSRTETARLASFKNADQSIWYRECILAENEISKLFLSGADFAIMHQFACQNRMRIDQLLNTSTADDSDYNQFGRLRDSSSIETRIAIQKDEYTKELFAHAQNPKASLLFSTIQEIVTRNATIDYISKKSKTYIVREGRRFNASIPIPLISSQAELTNNEEVTQCVMFNGFTYHSGYDLIFLKNSHPVTGKISYYITSDDFNCALNEEITDEEIISYLEHLEFGDIPSEKEYVYIYSSGKKSINSSDHTTLFYLLAQKSIRNKFEQIIEQTFSRLPDSRSDVTVQVIKKIEKGQLVIEKVTVAWGLMDQNIFKQDIEAKMNVLLSQLRVIYQDPHQRDQGILLLAELFQTYVRAIPLIRGSASIGLWMMNGLLHTLGLSLSSSLSLTPIIEGEKPLTPLPADVYAHLEMDPMRYRQTFLRTIQEQATPLSPGYQDLKTYEKAALPLPLQNISFVSKVVGSLFRVFQPASAPVAPPPSDPSNKNNMD